ncbi:hypothetical protein [Streptomyces sp. NPDC018584]
MTEPRLGDAPVAPCRGQEQIYEDYGAEQWFGVCSPGTPSG